ncbi:MAG: signal peptidase II [Erysipelotrichaceae bacterium]
MKKSHILTLVGILIVDQISKFIVMNNIDVYQNIEVIKGFFSLTYVRNTGAAWSIMEGNMIFFYIISIVALITMIGFYRNASDQDKYTKIGITLMISGTIGNLIDRVFLQYVRDFLSFIIFNYDFPVFNVADMALCIGVGFILLQIYLESYGRAIK